MRTSPDIAIRVDGIGKSYRLGARAEKYRSLREAIASTLAAPFRGARNLFRSGGPGSTLWALRDVSFEVAHGEVLGIIGRNGAGKSTLLKILSRVTEPTAGFAEVHGRMGSLLEVGTGFHPELTGRENVFLNGAILGMSRAEVQRKFDAIVAFAETEKFIDTAVKHYSSGMYLRLAFSVAAHLEPDILVVDEVLAVGDAAFQKKCLGKMSEVSGQGRTVLLVSHNMASIQALCDRVLVLEGGRLVLSDKPEVAIRKYLDHEVQQVEGSLDLAQHPNRVTAPERAIFRSLTLRDEAGAVTSTFPMGSRIVFEIEVDTADRPLNTPFATIVIEKAGTRICVLGTHYMVKDPFRLDGRMVMRCSWNPGWLAPGLYTVSRLSIKNYSHGDKLDTIEDPLSFEIVAKDVYGTGKVTADGVLLVPDASWEFASLNAPSTADD